ncbi:MAG TPA: tetratricopeptide repeat protein, partial [Candidatus Polarisedimenticolia bacterium]|nr:tetratricopeptide repeat protein [Candidatus Polarisedimenticolia bacterium]
APGLDAARGNLKDARRAARARRRGASPGPATDGAPPAEPFPTGEILDLLRRTPRRLSAGIVVRDDAVHLPACLASLSTCAAEILVVDARAAAAAGAAPLAAGGATLLRPRRLDDQAEARNALLRRARGDWVLLLDAAERLTAEGAAALPAALGDHRVLYHALEIRRGAPFGARLEVRLIRNAPGIRFHGRAEARATASLAALERRIGLGGGEPPIVVLGAGDSCAAAPADAARREALLRRDLAEDPTDGDALRARAWFDLRDGRPERALEPLRQARRTLLGAGRRPVPLDLEEATTLEALCLLRLERAREAADLIVWYHGRCRETSNTLYIAGAAAKAQGDAPRAADLLRRALDLRGRPGYLEALPEVAGAALPALYGSTLLERGDRAGARAAFSEALGRDARDLPAALGLIALQLSEGQGLQAAEGLDRLAAERGDDPRTWIAAGVLLDGFPALGEVSAAWMQEGRRRFPGHAEIARRAGRGAA